MKEFRNTFGISTDSFRESIEQGRTLVGLGRARFELGDHQQGMKDVQRAAELYRRIQDKY